MIFDTEGATQNSPTTEQLLSGLSESEEVEDQEEQSKRWMQQRKQSREFEGGGLERVLASGRL